MCVVAQRKFMYKCKESLAASTRKNSFLGTQQVQAAFLGTQLQLKAQDNNKSL